MFAQRSLSAAVFGVAATLPAVMAETCSAVGFRGTNSAGFAIGGTTYSSNQGIVLYNEARDVIGTYDLCNDCASVCADLIAIPTDNLPFVFHWGASCSAQNFSECHGSYDTQSHIDGEEPQSGADFYGLGISTDSQCRVNFECEL